MSRPPRKRLLRGRAERVREVAGVVFVWLILAILAAQGIASVVTGEYIGGTNYWGQPVGAFLQIGAAVIGLPVAVVTTVRSVRRIRASKSPPVRREGEPRPGEP